MISKIKKKEVKSIWKKKKQENKRGNVEKYLLSIMNPRTVFDNISECIMVLPCASGAGWRIRQGHVRQFLVSSAMPSHSDGCRAVTLATGPGGELGAS